MMNDQDLVDLFAMLAMQEFLKYELNLAVDKQNGQKWIAKQSYLLAKTMIEERKRANKPTKTT